MATGQTDALSARCGERLKRRVQAAVKQTRLSESEIVRVAAEEFLENHPTTKEQIEAVIRHREKAAPEDVADE